MQFQTIEVSTDKHVATVRLSRPDVRNAFNEIMIGEITGAFRALGAEPGIRAIVLAAAGKAFCAGADLGWMNKMAGFSRQENLADATELAEMLRTIYRCPKPVVAQVQGDCYAGGMGLVAAADIVVVVETMHFCLSETKLGLIPATISPYVIRAMGESAARRYFLTAERIAAPEALRLGFVHQVVGADALESTVGEIVNALVANSPNAVKEAKRLVQDMAGVALSDGLIADTAERIADIRSSEEGKEGVRSFLEKRRPGWVVE